MQSDYLERIPMRNSLLSSKTYIFFSDKQKDMVCIVILLPLVMIYFRLLSRQYSSYYLIFYFLYFRIFVFDIFLIDLDYF